ncbi:bifunctional (p)ppGpp synthetase/guanosine-3',5'-bis(diphosphate) 3'-pyrophosphohydrolase [Bombilactobacillus folatiphilus]|uniref:GTP diphosphokinase n=1 Tax=Bombilactobacillus folatiphilus TaxID=2923362 RepID=A0ABY4P7C8_9LACO|nr:bifunctional (p)ppGpp synthetase/guanosine-3',5'-bis(diphosphate) 3'-pyrophosphohydrolase [Bombilactobacillus folatiphilus]UQS81542.1 bifunctional (p)ppGpp synthetase/guanosine-3',5'-bis(diphosphate) 3'-pyrophosphohydrolase [Bombilactobacillus folatiphilus]
MSKEKVYTADEVFDLCSQYMNDRHVSYIKKAYEMADYVHQDQKRASGEAYIVHPIQVAAILAQLKMDPDTVSAGFLHDVVEDTKIVSADIRELFGDDVCNIVEGVTKISKYKYKSHQELLAANHRKMLLATAKDMRVIMVKLADRLNNMRTLNYLRPDKQYRIANETLEIYAPLADRLGISTIKWELEDLSLRYLNPQQYYRIVHLMNSKRTQREAYIQEAVQKVKNNIDQLHLHYDISGRAKHIYSIYKKMQEKHKRFEELYDLLAIRVMVNSVQDCYSVLGNIHAQWKPMPGRFKDYIAVPKVNGYQSLHTTVMGPHGRPLEVQIRTYDMHQIAEFGVAAHWAYKEGTKSAIQLDQNDQQIDVFREIMEIQEETTNDADFMQSVKGDIFSDRVYVFTPKGEVLELPKGSIPLDFAYQVHTEVGNHTIGVKVNGKMVPLDYKLRNGDLVELLTQSNATPSPDWENLVYTTRARNKIKRYFKSVDRQNNIELGRNKLERELLDRNLAPKNYLNKKSLQSVLERYNFDNEDELLATVGYGEISTIGVVNRLTENDRKKQELQKQQELEQQIMRDAHHNDDGNSDAELSTPNNETEDREINILGADNLLIHMGKCCTPIPGDKIVGYITKGRGITIHRQTCPNLQNEDESSRLIEAQWGNIRQHSYIVKLEIFGYNRNGLLTDVLQVVNKQSNLLSGVNGRIDADRMAHITLSVKVRNLTHLKDIINKLKNVPDVYDIQRVIN